MSLVPKAPLAPSPAVPPTLWEVDLLDADATVTLGQELAETLLPGDLVTLTGELGSGKTTLARAIVRALAGDPLLEVPSPTFTILQLYEAPSGPVVHADLYRIGSRDELVEIGWEETTADAIVLVEWPERIGGVVAPDRLDVHLSIPNPAQPNRRRARFAGHGAFAERLARSRAITTLLARAGWLTANRSHIQGDASTRSYERLRMGERSAILMVAPRRPDGPVLRAGRSYGEIAKLSPGVEAFVAMAEGLRAEGFSAPAVLAADLDTGLLLVEDLGSDGIADANGPVPERYAVAAELLAELHARELPATLPALASGAPAGEARAGVIHAIPPFDLEAYGVEVELLLDWYAPHVEGVIVASGARATFLRLWAEALAPIAAEPRTWTLRDYHSPNLLWLPRREGVARIGLIDIQDAVLGHPAYDLASLAQDARVTVPEALELKLLGAYARSRRARDPDFAMNAFVSAYAALGAQRATKVLGIFARLDKRDGKPQYLANLPRVRGYLRRNLSHPALEPIAAWTRQHLPRLLEDEGADQGAKPSATGG